MEAIVLVWPTTTKLFCCGSHVTYLYHISVLVTQSYEGCSVKVVLSQIVIFINNMLPWWYMWRGVAKPLCRGDALLLQVHFLLSIFCDCWFSNNSAICLRET
ncbi:hypothetical protein PVAP13_1NG145757 [Panicum virgatum]|uniref:Uncharacterized protein n=1 Tax=Panicum virgatum TaxID=38727 RepID=A0A8T0WWA7_PANVG|nr:hypothetical protein PVAP13_1NG145757 [Panicum virgatum]